MQVLIDFFKKKKKPSRNGYRRYLHCGARGTLAIVEVEGFMWSINLATGKKYLIY